MPITLFLTRTPLKEFLHGKQSGRFGELIAVDCPKVASARIVPGAEMPMMPTDIVSTPQLSSSTSTFPSLAKTMQMPAISRPAPMNTLSAPMPAITRSTPMPAMSRTSSFPAVKGQVLTKTPPGFFQSSFTPETQNRQFVKVEHGVLEITFAPLPGNVPGPTPVLTAVKRFTTIERFKTDSGPGFYVQLHPSPKPYWISYEPHNSVVKGLRDGHDGRCFRVHGGKSTPEQGILIHEAPHVGWVIGCIGPRPLKNFKLEFQNQRGNESYQSMEELFAFVGKNNADFFVLDW